MFDVHCKYMKLCASANHGPVLDTKFQLGNPSSNRAARLDVDSPNSVGELIIWSSGDYTIEVFDVEPEVVRFRAIGTVCTNKQFKDVLREFFLTFASSEN